MMVTPNSPRAGHVPTFLYCLLNGYFFNDVNGFFNLRQYRSRLFVGLTALMVSQNGFTTQAITKFQNKIFKFHHIYIIYIKCGTGDDI